MVIQNDGEGNFFLGTCEYGNFDLNNPTINYFRGFSHSAISAELTALLTQSSLQFRNVLSQADFDDDANFRQKTMFAFAALSDSIDDRYIFGTSRDVGGSGSSATDFIAHYDDNGYTKTDNTFDNANLVLRMPNNSSSSWSNTQNDFELALKPQFTVGDESEITWAGVSDSESLALFAYQYDFAQDKARAYFWYSGIVKDVNTGFGYYNANFNRRSVILSRTTDASNNNVSSRGAHYMNARSSPEARQLPETGDAAYPIVCSDAQTPTGKWATDFHIFDDDPALGNPRIGTARNLILAEGGTYTLGQPTIIQGSVFPPPANGQNSWLPVADWGSRTMLMRCYVPP